MTDPDPRDQHLDRYAESVCQCEQRLGYSHRLESGRWCFIVAANLRRKGEK